MALFNRYGFWMWVYVDSFDDLQQKEEKVNGPGFSIPWTKDLELDQHLGRSDVRRKLKAELQLYRILMKEFTKDPEGFHSTPGTKFRGLPLYMLNRMIELQKLLGKEI